MPFYPMWQSHLIERIRKEAGDNANRVDFFTAWTHDAPDATFKHSKPMIMANYLHTKIAFADGQWAAVGSANLDGASLDYFQILHAIQFRDNVNDELDYLFFNGIDGHPTAPAPDAIDLLRRGLWSEHLGLDFNDPQLAASNSANFLNLWQTRAATFLSNLQLTPANVDPTLGRALKFPTSLSIGLPWLFEFLYRDTNNERAFLTKSKITFDNLDLVNQVKAFQFFEGQWK
jgi:phosphatidylserine/phosphatidylglycerophosphate/cardiolipin synthase-like enzyme